MAPKKAPDAPVAVVAAPTDPEILAEQAKVEKWNQRIQGIQQKVEEAVKSLQTLESQHSQAQAALVKLQENAAELANRKQVSAAQTSAPAPTIPTAPVKGGAKNSTSPRGKAPEVAPTDPPAGQPTQQELEEENRKRLKVTTALLNLYKKKRAVPSLSTGGVVTTPRGTVVEAQAAELSEAPPSPNAAASGSGTCGEYFPKPNDVPADLWSAMLTLREERLTTEDRVLQIKGHIEKMKAHLAALRQMDSVVSYALLGSERDMRQVTARVEERRAQEQAAREAAAAAAAAAAAPSPAKKK